MTIDNPTSDTPAKYFGIDDIEISKSRHDYFSAIADYGFSHETVDRQSRDSNTFINDGIEGVNVKNSPIEGMGLFSERGFNPGDHIAFASVKNGKMRTIAGRYTNHSHDPNSKFVLKGADVSLVCTDRIEPNKEITIDYRDSASLYMDKNEIAKNDEGLSRVVMEGIDASMHDLLFSPDHAENLTLAERIYCFEDSIKSLPQLDIKADHELIDGLFKRQVVFPAGMVATGTYCDKAHMDVLLSGEMMVATETGSALITGPQTFTTLPNSKKAGMALTDCVWISYYPTSAETIDDALAEVFVEQPVSKEKTVEGI